MFIAFIGAAPAFFAGMSIIIGVARADGRALGSPLLTSIGDALGEGGPIVIPGIGAIVGWGEDCASVVCGTIQKTRAAEMCAIERHANNGWNFFNISYTW